MTSVKTRGTNFVLALQEMAKLESWARAAGNREQADMIKSCATVFKQSHRPPLTGVWVYAQRVAATHMELQATLEMKNTPETKRVAMDLYHKLEARLDSLVKQMVKKKVPLVDRIEETEYSPETGPGAPGASVSFVPQQKTGQPTANCGASHEKNSFRKVR